MHRLPLFLIVFAGCSGESKQPPAADADADSDSDSDVDVDSDSDGDWDAGTQDAGYEDCLGRCTDGLICCENAFGTGVQGCSDPLLDVHNCGACGVTCREDQVCGAGFCACPAGECDGRCVDLTWDPTNCGTCGTVCPGATPICFFGSCRSCEGTGGASCGEECPRVLEDESNCGACDVACADGQQCAAGACASPSCEDGCGRDGICCGDPWGGGGSGCTNVEWDYFNCGACGNECTGAATCVRGTCVPAECDARCDFGQVCCDSVWGGGEGCTSVEWDFGNCGQCSVACDWGEVCAEGECRAP